MVTFEQMAQLECSSQHAVHCQTRCLRSGTNLSCDNKSSRLACVQRGSGYFTGSRCRRFLLYSLPPDSTTYVLGSVRVFLTTAILSCPFVVCIRATCDSCSGESDLLLLSKNTFCICLFLESCALTFTVSFDLGFSICLLMGMLLRVTLDISLSAGKPIILSRGMLRMFSMFRNKSVPSLLEVSSKHFALQTALSARPFAWGYSGLLVM